VNIKAAARISLSILCGLFLALHIASKIHFFTNYNPLGVGDFIRERRVYWVAMAATAFSIWPIERFRQDKP
jgi:hypothetical protein